MSDSIMPATIAAPDLEGLRKLREPFPPEQIGMLPKPTKKDNKKGECKVCGKYHGLPAVHLDYVGHAAVTDRLRSVDPTWTWEPMALAADGLPAVRVGNGMATLWIRLTACGVTRPGVGIVDATKSDVNKELISDAIRNAAMRFGVALDLWSKEELHFEGGDAPNGNGADRTDADQRDDSAHVPPTRDREALVTQVRSTVAQIAALDADQGMAADAYVEGELKRADLTPAELRQLGVKLLQRLSKVRNGSAPATESVDTETGEVQEVGAAEDA